MVTTGILSTILAFLAKIVTGVLTNVLSTPAKTTEITIYEGTAEIEPDIDDTLDKFRDLPF